MAKKATTTTPEQDAQTQQSLLATQSNIEAAVTDKQSPIDAILALADQALEQAQSISKEKTRQRIDRDLSYAFAIIKSCKEVIERG
jgi:hypothetical protein